MRHLALVLSIFISIVALPQRVGIVLSGGGASGFAHVGMLRALEENGIPIDYITGSSMGAVVGAFYAAGFSPADMDSLFRTELFQTMASGGVEDRFIYYFKQDPPDASVISLKVDLDTSLQASLPTNLRSPALLDFEQMRQLAPVSALAGYDLDSLFVPFRCVASDITNKRQVVFRKGDLASAVRASMSYPFYFKPIRIGGDLMMDGGLYNNFPSDVMYDEFYPDIIIGCNVAYESEGPTEDDLLSQLRAMLQEQTNYSVICENGIIIEPKTENSLFDFESAKNIMQAGYDATVDKMPEILAAVRARDLPQHVQAARDRFNARKQPLEFRSITIEGLNRPQRRYALRTLRAEDLPMGPDEIKPGYFRLMGDRNISSIYPTAVLDTVTGKYDLQLLVKTDKDLEVRFGGIFSSRPVTTGMASLRYKLFDRTSTYTEVASYFGKFYSGIGAKGHIEFATRVPSFIEPAFMLHRFDHFRNFTSFFQEENPSFIVMRELWSGFSSGIALNNKGMALFDVKYAQTKDSYYQGLDFTNKDTADVTEFFHLTTGLGVERNSLNRKQHPNEGEHLFAEVRYVNGEERTVPGSTSPKDQALEARHDWIYARARLDKYFLPRWSFKVGVLLEAVYSSLPLFQNYKATVIRAPHFAPTPEINGYFIEDFRAQQYGAVGLRTIFTLGKRFDLRFEGYVFQPYRPIIRTTEGQAEIGEAISERRYIGSGSLIYQSPVGPLWINTSYLDGLRSPWVFSLNYGFFIFGPSAQRPIR